MLEPRVRREGAQVSAALGRSAAGARDINGDGFDEVIVGAPFAASAFPAEGRASVYMGSAGGGVWKTTNAGRSWENISDGTFGGSIGAVAVSEWDPNVIYVGGGEKTVRGNVGHGDGLWRSENSGKTWTSIGLEDSHHVPRIRIHPRDPDTAWAAVLGHLYGPHPTRGVYKTTDGGVEWIQILGGGDYTGVNEVAMDPSNPDVLYAATHQRFRNVAALIDGGPETGIHKSTDAGKSWRKVTRGLPGGDKGRIGMDISPADPNVLYAIVEAASGGGFFRSTDRGETWSKRSSVMSSSPQYYNEVVCDPIDANRVYMLDTRSRVSDDGGATFNVAGNRDRHVALAA